jgi:hypothetical protein
VAFRPPITRSLALSLFLLQFSAGERAKGMPGKNILAIQFLFTNGSLLPSPNPLKNKANQRTKFFRVLKRANKILCRHGGHSIEMIPVIYFPEGIIAGFSTGLKFQITKIVSS